MRLHKVFVFELAPVYRRQPGAIRIDEIAACKINFGNFNNSSDSTLNHEILDDTMERTTLVTDWHAIFFVLASAKLSKVLGCFRANIAEKLKF